MIEMKDLSRSYSKGQIKAVRHLNLKVEPGELFGFLGPNGAGKTTTIKMMVGLLRPEEGDIFLNGVSIKEDPVKAKSFIGYVPDEPMAYRKMTGLGFLSFIGEIYGVKNLERARELATIFEIHHALEEVIDSYSHGMKQKLGIIAALVHEPSVLILDEPIVGLDPKGAFNLKKILREHCDKGHTVFFSTHVMEIAEKICHRVGIIHKGELLMADKVENLPRKEGVSLEEMFLEMTAS